MKRLLRKILGVARNGRRRNVDVRGAELKIIDNDVADTVQRRRLAYFGCVVRMYRERYQASVLLWTYYRIKSKMKTMTEGDW